MEHRRYGTAQCTLSGLRVSFQKTVLVHHVVPAQSEIPELHLDCWAGCYFKLELEGFCGNTRASNHEGEVAIENVDTKHTSRSGIAFVLAKHLNRLLEGLYTASNVIVS